MRLWVSVSALALVGCEIPVEKPSERPESPQDVLSGSLNPQQQQRRLLACLDRFEGYRDELVQAGGVEPRISALAWGRLDPSEQEEFIAVVACIKARGQTGRQSVVLRDMLREDVMIEATSPNNLRF